MKLSNKYFGKSSVITSFILESRVYQLKFCLIKQKQKKKRNTKTLKMLKVHQSHMTPPIPTLFYCIISNLQPTPCIFFNYLLYN